MPIDWVAEEAFVPLVRLDPRIRNVVPMAFRRWREAPLAAGDVARVSRASGARCAREDVHGDPRPAGAGQGRASSRAWRADAGTASTAQSIREPLATWFDDVHHRIARDQHFIDKARALAAAALGYRVEGPPRWQFAPPDADGGHAGGAVRARVPRDEPRRQAVARGSLARAARALRAARASRRCCRGAAQPKRERSRAAGRRNRERRSCRRGRRCPNSPRSRATREVVVGVDTGLTHLAAALGTPTVAVFTATDAALAGVARAGAHALDVGGNGARPVVRRGRVGAGPRAARRAAMLMRALYTLLWFVALPWLPLRLWWRGRREPGYRGPHRRALRPLRGRRAVAARRRRLDPRGVARRDARRGAAHRAHRARAARTPRSCSRT